MDYYLTVTTLQVDYRFLNLKFLKARPATQVISFELLCKDGTFVKAITKNFNFNKAWDNEIVRKDLIDVYLKDAYSSLDPSKKEIKDFFKNQGLRIRHLRPVIKDLFTMYPDEPTIYMHDNVSHGFSAFKGMFKGCNLEEPVNLKVLFKRFVKNTKLYLHMDILENKLVKNDRLATIHEKLVFFRKHPKFPERNALHTVEGIQELDKALRALVKKYK